MEPSDINERKGVAEWSSRFAHVLDQSFNEIYIFDAVTLRFVEVNRGARENLGYTMEELSRLTAVTLKPEFCRRECQAQIESLHQSQKSKAAFETVHQRKDRSLYPVEVRLHFSRTETPPLFIAIVQDITERNRLKDEIHEHKRAEEELKESRKQLRGLNSRLQSIREEERTRIARQVHDELGQALTALKFDLAWLEKRLPQDLESLLQKTRSMSTLIETTVQVVHRISTELRPQILDVLGLCEALKWQVREFKNRTGIRCEVTFSPEHIDLDRERSTTLFRILQETLTNVVRHAQATEVHISLRRDQDDLVLAVKDNGRGITKRQASDSQSLGLIGIRERALLWGGGVSILGIEGKGVSVSVRIPLEHSEKTK